MFSDKKLKQLTIKNGMVIITYAVFLIFVLINIEPIYTTIKSILSLTSPFFVAAAMAYVFNLPMNFFLKKLPNQLKARKIVAALLTVLVFTAIIFMFVQIIAPQLGSNFATLAENIPGYIEASSQYLTKLSKELDLSPELLKQIESYGAVVEEWIVNFATTMLPKIVEIGKGFTTGIFNFFLSIVIAIYMTLNKEKLLGQLHAVLYAFFPTNVYEYVRKTGTLANSTFSNFISGQMVEAIIIGVLCYIGCSLLKIPYASIIGLVIGLTNIIPIFGPIIGTFFCGFLVLFVSPIKAVIFVIFGICLQQVESNLIYPKVVGTSVGLSGLWVLFAITLGGGMFGLLGMLLGLPTFAIIYRLFGDEVYRRIRMKKARLAKIEQTDSSSEENTTFIQQEEL